MRKGLHMGENEFIKTPQKLLSNQILLSWLRLKSLLDNVLVSNMDYIYQTV